ncbi:hypothetical protein Deipe_0617 [Deinococcus peraridilitoris DSM 19664]|uniref:Uncharacterized protein n=1 Tax=Deinococcus peraridilitoris (strain DSM 19664 / LMG 22246 / CIP 109416 / KR-200) TaxID=937777 RepID=K9ZZ66_DEIPD|nr:hypothetical protein Deipe_0617 [Deinococcus peraridilitoris DSM 19664]
MFIEAHFTHLRDATVIVHQFNHLARCPFQGFEKTGKNSRQKSARQRTSFNLTAAPYSAINQT